MADKLPHFIYVIRAKRFEMLRSGPTAEEARILQEHSDYLKDLADKGVVVLAGRTLNNDETTFGIAIVEAVDEAAARAVMENDPFVKSGLMNATFFPFRIAFTAR
jgi:uncharacterized protein YciI